MKKKTIRFKLTMAGVKLLIKTMKALGKNATNLPGEVALRLCPDILSRLDMPETIIGVTGTNGKTTVTNLIADALEKNGYDFISNRFGGNIETGILSALIAQSTISGKPKKNMAVLELDERSANKIYPYLKPDILVCTNLTRDSLKRNAHAEYIFNFLEKFIPEKTKLILNGDDMISFRLCPDNKRVYFGMDKQDGETSIRRGIINDLPVCPLCGSALEYEFLRYNHIGRGHCTKCDFSSPKIDYNVRLRDLDSMKIVMENHGKTEEYRLIGENITDACNTAAAVAALHEFGLTAEQISSAFNSIKLVETRFTNEKIGNIEVTTHLAKGQNPVACSRVMDFVASQPGNKAVILILEDYYESRHSSENVAWIYETDFEFLNVDSVKQVIAGGKRFADYEIRMLFAGIPEEKIAVCENELDTAKQLRISNIDRICILQDVFNTFYLKKIKADIAAKIEEGNK